MNSSEQRNIRHVLMVAREYDGLAGAGGVKDVCRQLAEALVQHAGCDVRVVLPRYGFMDATALGFVPMSLPCLDDSGQTFPAFDVDMNYVGRERREQVALWTARMRGVVVYLVESPRFAEKHGVYTYTPEEESKKAWQHAGSGHFDFFAMNILLQKAALDMMILLNFRPDVIHCHDGHAATLPAMMRECTGYRHFFCRSGAVVTIHNAGMGYHQEVADLDFAEVVASLPLSVVRSGTFNGCFDPFAVAAPYARMNTVSENYARELQETGEDSRTGWLGHHLLRKGVRLSGITNGISSEDFDPRNAEKLGIDAPFDPAAGDLAGKRRCKEGMLAVCRLGHDGSSTRQYGSLRPDPELPLFTFVGRLTSQKGVDILLKALLLMASEGEVGFQTLVLGSGEKQLEEQLRSMADDGDGRLCFQQGYDPALAMRVYAAGDFFLVPSLYEPCGLTDYIAQLLGNLPIVHHVGGLVKVIDQETGIAYKEHAPEALAGAMQQALSLFRHGRDRLSAMQRSAAARVRDQHSWKRTMHDYMALYRQALP